MCYEYRCNRFANELVVGYIRGKGINDNSKVFDLSNERIEVALDEITKLVGTD